MPAQLGQEAARPRGAGPVVICCATADATAIASVVTELERQGHAVDLVTGVEHDPHRLVGVIDRCRGQGLYVLCRSRALDREAVERLRDVLLSKHIPFGRSLTVASTRPRELQERIMAGLGRLAAVRARRGQRVPPEGRRVPPEGHPVRAVARRTTQLGIPLPMPSAAPARSTPVPKAVIRAKTQLGIPVSDLAELFTGDPNDEEPATTPRVSPGTNTHASRRPPAESEDTQAEALLEDLTKTQPFPLEDTANAAVGASDSLTNVSLITAEDLADLGITDLAGSKPIELSATDMLIDIGSHPVPVRTGNTHRVRLEQPLGRDPRPRPVAPSVPTPTPAPAPTRAATPQPPRPRSTLSTPPVHVEPRSRTWLWVAVSVAAAGLMLAVTATLVSNDAETFEQVADASPSSTRRTEAAAESHHERAPEPQAQPDGVEDAAPAAAVPGSTSTLVMEALRNRNVRALDILLVTPEPLGVMTFDKANRECAALSIEGLGHWRLPEIGELRSLDTADMIGKGYYWSRTAADTFGDLRLAYYGRYSRVLPRSDNSYVMCVRGEHGAG